MIVVKSRSQGRLDLETCFDHLKKLEFYKAKESLSEIEDEGIRRSLHDLILVLENEGQKYKLEDFSSRSESIQSNSDILKSISLLTRSSAEIVYNQMTIQTFNNLVEALDLSKNTIHRPLTKQIYLAILNSFKKDVIQISKDYEYYLNEYRDYVDDPIDYAYYTMNNFVFQSKTDDSIDYNFHHASYLMDSAFSSLDETSKLIPLYLFEKAIYNGIINMEDDAKYYYDSLLNIPTDFPYYRYINFGTYLKLSEIEAKNGNFRRSWALLTQTDQYKDLSQPLISDYYYYRYGSQYYQELGDSESALTFLQRANELEIEINKITIMNTRAQAMVAYDTLDKEKRIQQATYLITILSVLTFFALVLMIFYRSRQRMMRVVSLKNEEIFNQEINQLLSDQELKSINSMIEGQEKERKRVAEDLHDRLGSTLTAAKMHIDVLSDQNGELDKIGELLNKALTDTREISHNMLSGVLTNFGLVAALKDLIETVEGANKIRIHLSYSELDKRLDSQLEINVYRILQELISNTLKHAKASQIKINFKKEDEQFLMQYSDNGVGFNTSLVKFDGIGFKNIAARVSKVGGEWDYSSKPGEGFYLELKLSF